MSAHPFAESNRAAAKRQLSAALLALVGVRATLVAARDKGLTPGQCAGLEVDAGDAEYLVNQAITMLGRADEIERLAEADTLVPLPPESEARRVVR